MKKALKRVWKTVDLIDEAEKVGWSISLAGKKVHLPSGNLLLVPTLALATAIKEEWERIPFQHEVRPDDLIMTRIMGNKIDRISPHLETIRESLLAYGCDDTLCYRHEGQDKDLLEKALNWSSLNGFNPIFTNGIMPISQPDDYIMALRNKLNILDENALTVLGVIVPALASLLLGFAVLENGLSVDDAVNLASAEELWQLQKGGYDEEIETRVNKRLEDVMQGRRFFSLISS